jgi:hypothetical protein
LVSLKRSVRKEGFHKRAARIGRPEEGSQKWESQTKKISFLISQLWHLNPDTSYLTSHLWYFISDVSSLVSDIK